MSTDCTSGNSICHTSIRVNPLIAVSEAAVFLHTFLSLTGSDKEAKYEVERSRSVHRGVWPPPVSFSKAPLPHVFLSSDGNVSFLLFLGLVLFFV